MKFQTHINKSFWIAADKLTFSLYGVLFTLLVIRHLSPIEYAGYALIYQSLFMMIVAVISSFALQPLFKYAAETDNIKPIISITFFLLLVSVMLFSVLPVVFKNYLERWFNTPGLNSLIYYIPLLNISFMFRLFMQTIFQSKYRVKEIFFINLFFIGVSTIWLIYQISYSITLTAYDIIIILSVSSGLSSIISYLIGKEYVKFDFNFKSDKFKEVVKFGSFSVGNTSTFFVFGYLDHYMIAFFSGAEQVALYAVAKTFSRVFDMFSQVSQSLLIPVVSRLSVNKDFTTLSVIFEKAVCFTQVTLLPIMIIYSVFPLYFFQFLFGEKYNEGIILVQFFSLLALTVPWTSVIGSYYVGLSKLKTALILNIIFLLGTIILFTILIPHLFAAGATISVLIATGITTIIHVIIIKKYVPFKFKNILFRVNDIYRFANDLKANNNKIN